MRHTLVYGIILFIIMGCETTANDKTQDSDTALLSVRVYETAADGRKLEELSTFATTGKPVGLQLLPDQVFQTITGFGGSFTEASAYLLNQVSQENRDTILNAYFGDEGARYSLTRTHMNSCDFSLSNYSYAPVPGDDDLSNFSVKEDEPDYTMVHFSKYIRPGAQRIGFTNGDEELMVTAIKNLDGCIATVVLNQTDKHKTISVKLGEAAKTISISPRALQTIIITP